MSQRICGFGTLEIVSLPVSGKKFVGDLKDFISISRYNGEYHISPPNLPIIDAVS
jgi:hypothetical protein